MPTLRQATRQLTRESGREELLAAQPLNLRTREDRQYFTEVINSARRAGRVAWDHYDTLGEIHSSIRRTARVAGYAKLRAVKIESDGTEVEPDPLAADIVKNIYSPYGGVRGLIERFYTLLKVPADMTLIRVVDSKGPNGYIFLSADEIDRTSTDSIIDEPYVRWLTLPNATQYNGERMTRRVERRDVLGRVWQQHPRFVDLSDSPLAALSTECDVLRSLTLSVKAKLRSRFAMAGLVFIPNSLQHARVAGINPAGGKMMNVIDTLIMAMSRNVVRLDDPNTWVPILIQGDPDAGEKIKHIRFDSEVWETDIKLRAEVIERILYGLDIQQVAAKGSEDQSHWGGWLAADEERRIAVGPDLDTLGFALERLILHPQLDDAGVEPAEVLKHHIAWDLSEAAVHTNQQEDFRQLADRGLLGGKSLRRVSGATDEDMPEQWELIRGVGRQMKIPYLALVPEGTTFDDIDWSKVTSVSTGPGKSSEGEEPSAGPGVGDPGSPNDDDRDTPRQERPAN